jgi:hypothetical protein
VRTHLGDSFLITIISPFIIAPVEKVSFLSISSVVGFFYLLYSKINPIYILSFFYLI